MVAASNAFNQVIEKDTDSLMKRTMNRPLPTGRMTKTTAIIFAITSTIVGLAYCMVSIQKVPFLELSLYFCTLVRTLP